MSQYAAIQPREVKIEFEDQEIRLNVRDLTYAEILKAISNSYVNEIDPRSHQRTRVFDFLEYWREIISRAYSASPPWNDKTELLKISPAWAQALESQLPKDLFTLGKDAGDIPNSNICLES